MAHTKAAGVTKGNRDSKAKRLGVKSFSGQTVHSGAILVRQRGTPYLAGPGVKKGADDTLYAAFSGKLQFLTRLGKRFVSVVANS